MDTNSGEATTISHLFSPEPAAAPVNTATEQPLPPDVTDGYNVPPPAVEPAPAVAPQVQPEPQPQVQQPQTHMVPLAELISERKERQQYAQQVQQLTEAVRRLTQPQQQAPQPQPIDPEVDPAGAFNALRSEFSTALLSQRLDFSESKAREVHGNEAVDAAFEAATKSGFREAFVSKPDAYGEMVKWHKAQQLQQTIGTDPAAYAEQLKAQIRAQLLAEFKQGTPPPSNLPPSLSSATRATPAGTPEVMGSDKDFFKATMNPRRG